MISGSLGVAQEAMEAQVLEAHRNGLQIGVHASGDRFISMVMDAYEKPGSIPAPQPPAPHRALQCDERHLLARMKHLGLVGIPFGEYIYYHGEERPARTVRGACPPSCRTAPFWTWGFPLAAVLIIPAVPGTP